MQDPGSQSFARHASLELQVRDVAREGGDTIKMDIAQLRFKLLFGNEELGGYHTIGVARIIETKEDNSVLLDEEHIPTCTDVSASERLKAFVVDPIGMLKIRADEIARVRWDQKCWYSEFWWLLNSTVFKPYRTIRYSFIKNQRSSPRAPFAEIVQLLGELSTFLSGNKRPPVFPPYAHDNLTATFLPLINAAKNGLSVVVEQTAVPLKVEDTPQV